MSDCFLFRKDSMERETQFREDDQNQQFFANNQEQLLAQHQDLIHKSQQTTTVQFTKLSTLPSRGKYDLKNFPKQLGNNLAKVHKKAIDLPKGIRNLRKKRKQSRQSKITIRDLREICECDEESRVYFQIYVESEVLIDAIFSNKIQFPLSLVPAISNYWAAAEEPHKMVSNQLMVQYFQN